MSWLTRWLPWKSRKKAKAETQEHWFAGPPVEGAPPKAEPDLKQLPRFQATAADRPDRIGFGRPGSVRLKLRGAFTPSLPVTDPAKFAGRVEVLSSMIRAIEDQRLHAVVYGERGIGKTSLLHIISQLARDARYLVVYVSCGAGSNFDEMVRQIADEIPLLYHADHGPTAADTEAGSTFASLLPPGPISVRVATDLFAKVVGTRVLVVLDEFDRSESIEFRRAVAELLKTLSDRVIRVQLVIAGVASDLTQLVEHVPSIQRNIFALRLPKMDAAEVSALLKKGGDQSGLSFDDDAAAAIVVHSNGIPYLASLLSFMAASHAVDAGRTAVSAEDVAAAVDEALAELKGRISKKSQLKIADTVRKGAHVTLGRLAGRAQAAGGQFVAEDIAALFPKPDQAARCSAVIHNYAQAGGLLESSGEEEGAFRFKEESVMPYLWLLASKTLATEQDVAPKLSEPVVPALER